MSPPHAPCVGKGEKSCSEAHWGHPLGKLRIGGYDYQGPGSLQEQVWVKAREIIILIETIKLTAIE